MLLHDCWDISSRLMFAFTLGASAQTRPWRLASRHGRATTAVLHTCVGDFSVPGPVQLPSPAFSLVHVPAQDGFHHFGGSSRSSGSRRGRHDCCRCDVSGCTYSLVSHSRHSATWWDTGAGALYFLFILSGCCLWFPELRLEIQLLMTSKKLI